MENFDELYAFFMVATDLAEDEWTPLKLSPDDLTEALWPMNDIFKPKLSRLNAMAYSIRFEAEADLAVLEFAQTGKADAFEDRTSGAWRVLAERHVQALTMCMASGAAGEAVIWTIPAQLPDTLRTRAAVLQWWLRMKLPYAPHDRGALVLPSGAVPGPITRQ